MAFLAADLIDGAQALADKRNDASISASDWARYVNDGIEDLYRLLVPLDSSLYFTQSDFTLTGGAAGSTLNLTTLSGPGPANTKWRAIHGVDLNPDQTFRRTVPRRPFRERNITRVGWWLPTLEAMDRRYDIRQYLLTITPYESAAGNYRIYWRQAPYKFTGSTDTNTLDTQMEPYDDYIRVFAAIVGLGIEESDTSPLTARLADMRQAITQAEQRDDEPAVISDVEIGDGNAWVFP